MKILGEGLGVRVLTILNKYRCLYRPVKYALIIALSVFILLFVLLLFWYNHFFFPNDQEYLQRISESVEPRGSHVEEKELDILEKIGSAVFSRPLSLKDREFLFSAGLKTGDYYIDENPYGLRHPNNLKYSTGKIFYYIYQKNALVLKAGSMVSFNISGSDAKGRFIELDAVMPGFSEAADGAINIYFRAGNRRTLLKKNIRREIKPDIRPFRYSNVFSAISFYLKHPARSVLPSDAGWEKIRTDLPKDKGTLEIEFTAGNQKTNKNYLFIGSPAIYSVRDNKRNEHINIVYLIFDTFSKSHIDLYEYYDIFGKMPPDKAYAALGKRRIITPSIDKYADRILLFENMFSVGQVTRPSIVPLWTSQTYTRSRLPVFRNVVTDENREEYYRQGFSTLGRELSKQGFFTKQISCNAQGHGVSGVGVDLGFDENYDYTMEATEKPENFRRIMEFLNENQNRKFFLYSHINVPHPPKWIPIYYFISALPEVRFSIERAKMLGNIRYLNDSLGKVMNALDKLGLMENTVVVITADHSGGRIPYFRGEITGKDKKISMGDSQSVATFHSRAIYGREGGQHLLNSYMNIPWIMIKPDNLDFKAGKINSYVSSLDISPTLLDIALNAEYKNFSGKSFKGLLNGTSQRDEVFNDFIPLVGRFQHGFVLDGRYKYWINLQGLYKYRAENNKKYIMQQEYLYDLKNDPDEINNLARDSYKNDLLKKMRTIYFNRMIEYPDKNFIQISPSLKGSAHVYRITAESLNGKLIYPKIYGDGIGYFFESKNRIIFNCTVKDKAAFFSFETDPPESHIKISIYKNGKILEKKNIYSSVECINIFDNPIILTGKDDFHIGREPGRTGLEIKDIPAGSVYYSRIPLNYWMEMNLSDKDIKLSPGIKEVLRGWGYIQ